jgi:hypothetical protein
MVVGAANDWPRLYDSTVIILFKRHCPRRLLYVALSLQLLDVAILSVVYKSLTVLLALEQRSGSNISFHQQLCSSAFRAQKKL